MLFIILVFVLIIILAIVFLSHKIKYNTNKYCENSKYGGNSKNTKLLNKTLNAPKYVKNHNFIIKKNNIIQTDINHISPNNYKSEGYINFSKEIYHNIANHSINLTKLDIKSVKNSTLQAKRTKPKSYEKYTHWASFENWDQLQKDPVAKKEYLEEKNKIIEYPNLDWSDVLKELLTKLKENREYIGIINLNKKTNKLYIKKYEGSPTTADEENSDTTFASIPSYLVDKYSNIVGLFMFHTHPEDIRGSPLPSSYDLSAALYFSSISRFAASVIISRYGVLMYGLSIYGYNFLSKSKDYNLAVLNLSFDVIAAHESIRSWSKWRLSDYSKFYERYKMFMHIFPSSEYVSDNIKYDNEWNINNAISYDLILDHYDDINNYLKK